MGFFSWIKGGENSLEKASPMRRAEILLNHTPKDSPRALQLKRSLAILHSNIPLNEKIQEAESVRRNDSLVWLNLVLGLQQDKEADEGIFLKYPDLSHKVKEARSFAREHKVGGSPSTPVQEQTELDKQSADDTLAQFAKAIEKSLKPLFGSSFQEELAEDAPRTAEAVAGKAANDNEPESKSGPVEEKSAA